MNENSTQTSTTRVEEMLTAAKRIRDTAAGIVQGWYSSETFAHSFGEEDGAWAALMHPGLAEPLAVWLEREALWAHDHDGMPRDLEALAFARAINGGTR